jgi:signal transduction histidine kinase
MWRALHEPSIARRLVLAVLFACAGVWLAVYAVGRAGVYASESGSFDREMLTLSEAAVRVLAHGEPAGLAGLAASIDADVALDGFPAGFLAFRVTDAQGRGVARGGEAPDVDADPAVAEGFADTRLGGHAFRLLRRWTPDRAYRIDVTQSIASRERTFDAVMFSGDGLRPLLVGVPLLLLPVWLAVHTGLRPLRRLSRELAARPPSDLQPLAVPAEYRELAPVVTELNATLARLQGLLDRERAFLADAAHELRTPLAVVSAQCDTLIQSRSPEDRDAAASRLRQGLARAHRLVGQLLALARLEAGQPDDPVPSDVADVVRDTLASHAPAARTAGIELAYVGPDSLVRPCAPEALVSVLDNLVGNAVRYGRPHGRVEVVLAPNADGLHLSVRDDGPGIAPAERERVFERFHRGVSPSASGSGLGLAIVASAARRLGARIHVGDGLGGEGVSIGLHWHSPQPGAPTLA